MSNAEMIVRNVVSRMSFDQRISRIWHSDGSPLMTDALAAVEPEAVGNYFLEQDDARMEGYPAYDEDGRDDNGEYHGVSYDDAQEQDSMTTISTSLEQVWNLLYPTTPWDTVPANVQEAVRTLMGDAFTAPRDHRTCTNCLGDLRVCYGQDLTQRVYDAYAQTQWPGWDDDHYLWEQHYDDASHWLNLLTAQF